MLAEYLLLKDAVDKRSLAVGRLLRASKHYGCYGYPISIATPFAAEITTDSVKIAVGMNTKDEIGVISTPAPLFESASDNDIRSWVSRQNQEHNRSKEDIDNEETDKRRRQELTILHELMSRYPEETAHHE